MNAPIRRRTAIARGRRADRRGSAMPGTVVARAAAAVAARPATGPLTRRGAIGRAL
jgi:hypothetical protein